MDNLTSYNVMLNNNFSEFDVWLGDVRRPGPPKCQCNKVLLLPISNLTLTLSSFDSCLCGRCHGACCAFSFWSIVHEVFAVVCPQSVQQAAVLFLVIYFCYTVVYNFMCVWRGGGE